MSAPAPGTTDLSVTRPQLPKLLWLAIEPPWPANSGGRLRSLALLHAAAERFAVTLVVLFGMESADHGPLSGLDWVTCRADPVGKLVATAKLLAHGWPPYLRHFGTPAQRRTVLRLLATGDYSVVVADTPYSAAALPDPARLRRAAGRRGRRVASPVAPAGRPALLVNTHNVEAEVWRAATAQVSGGRVFRALDRRLVGAWERTVLASADAAAFCSARDRALMETGLRRNAHTAVVPNAVDTQTLERLERPVQSDQALFLGGLSYGPNREAARFIVTSLAPRLTGFGISVVIAGGKAGDLGSAAVQSVSCRAASGAVCFVGRPAEVRPLYERSYASIMPIFSGGGTRLKVLESFAYGRPVVSTAKGVEGLSARPDEHYLPAETGEQFAAQLNALRDPRLVERLAAAGRALVEERYSWRVSGRSFLQLLQATLSDA